MRITSYVKYTIHAHILLYSCNIYCSIKQMNKFLFFRFVRKQNTTFNSTVIFVREKGMSDERWAYNSRQSKV